MAAALAIEAHGRALRLAAEVAGVHFQRLAALAGGLRKQGCSDRRLLRRLAALDAAVGVLRHITVVSVGDMEMDLQQALLNLKPKNTEVEEPQVDSAHIEAVFQQTVEQLDVQLEAVMANLMEEPPLEEAATFQQVDPHGHPEQVPPYRLGGARS